MGADGLRSWSVLGLVFRILYSWVLMETGVDDRLRDRVGERSYAACLTSSTLPKAGDSGYLVHAHAFVLASFRFHL